MRLIHLIALLFLVLATVPAVADPTAVGRWTQFDDTDGKPRSVVRIDETAAGFEGHIEKVFPHPGEGSEPVCRHCTGALQGQKIAGMRFIWAMHREGLQYTGGSILDPGNGKTYSGRMSLSADGQTLLVRGFIGISLLGRSQTWTRLP